MLVNSVVKMHCAYRPHSIVTASMIVPMKVTRQIVRQSHVQTINSYVHVVDRTVHQNVLRKQNCAMANVIAKMVPMKKPHAVSNNRSFCNVRFTEFDDIFLFFLQLQWHALH